MITSREHLDFLNPQNEHNDARLACRKQTCELVVSAVWRKSHVAEFLFWRCSARLRFVTKSSRATVAILCSNSAFLPPPFQSMAARDRTLSSVSLLASLARRSIPSICPTCAFSQALQQTKSWRSDSASVSSNQRGPRQVRYASTHASRTAINAAKEVPPRFRDLHQSLEVLKKEATNYVNISRLHLALRSLESPSPVVRVAILGLRSTRAAKRLARSLLVDVLSDESEWEKQLTEVHDNDQRGILLRSDSLRSREESCKLTPRQIWRRRECFEREIFAHYDTRTFPHPSTAQSRDPHLISESIRRVPQWSSSYSGLTACSPGSDSRNAKIFLWKHILHYVSRTPCSHCRRGHSGVLSSGSLHHYGSRP